MSAAHQSPAGAGISVVINARNEERHLPYALRSVIAWADDVVVVDMASEDRTAAVARDLGVRVVAHADIGWVEPARAFALAQATQPWILALDADELVPPGLAQRLRELALHPVADVVRIPRVNYLLGAPLFHAGWNPERERHARFFRAGAVSTPTRLHQPFQPLPGTRIHDLPYREHQALIHFNYLDVDHFVAKLAHYTSLEAEHARARGERSSRWRAVVGGAREWGVRYLWHGGFRDGWRGFYLSLLMAFYRATVEAKLASREHLGDAASVDELYRREAERLLGLAASGSDAARCDR